MGKIYLAGEGDESVDRFAINTQRTVQIATRLRAEYTRPYNRRNVTTRISFHVKHTHSSLLEAQVYMCRHEANLQTDAIGGLVQIICYAPGSSTTIYYLHNAQLESHDQSRHGVTTLHSYTLVGGRFSTDKPES
jgi:hypothetical protein